MTNEEAIERLQMILINDTILCMMNEKDEEAVHHAIKTLTIEPKRKFIRIITTYYPDDCICYEEYKGKPYFSIEYRENGETFVGYGTYNPDVLSGYLRDYFFQ